jgi:hypothetical protein
LDAPAHQRAFGDTDAWSPKISDDPSARFHQHGVAAREIAFDTTTDPQRRTGDASIYLGVRTQGHVTGDLHIAADPTVDADRALSA